MDQLSLQAGKIHELKWYTYVIISLSLFGIAVVLNYILKKINEARHEERVTRISSKATTSQSTQMQSTIVDPLYRPAPKPATPIFSRDLIETARANIKVLPPLPVPLKNERVSSPAVMQKTQTPNIVEEDPVIVDEILPTEENSATISILNENSLTEEDIQKPAFLGNIYKDLQITPSAKAKDELVILTDKTDDNKTAIAVKEAEIINKIDTEPKNQQCVICLDIPTLTTRISKNNLNATGSDLVISPKSISSTHISGAMNLAQDTPLSRKPSTSKSEANQDAKIELDGDKKNFDIERTDSIKAITNMLEAPDTVTLTTSDLLTAVDVPTKIEATKVFAITKAPMPLIPMTDTEMPPAMSIKSDALISINTILPITDTLPSVAITRTDVSPLVAPIKSDMPSINIPTKSEILANIVFPTKSDVTSIGTTLSDLTLKSGDGIESDMNTIMGVTSLKSKSDDFVNKADNTIKADEAT